jgi:hypothetical protein
MEEFLAIIFSMPTLPWTGLVIAALIYWTTVIAGALDIDVLGGGHDADVGHIDVGHAHGGDLHPIETGHGDAGHAHGDHGVADAVMAKEGVLSALLSALKLRSVPVTISLSLLGISGWLVSFLLVRNLSALLPLPSFVTAAIEFLISLLIATLVTSALVRPLAPLFRSRSAPRHQELVGKVVRITTGRVDGRFGEGHLQDGGAGLALQVRCADPDALDRDDEALILGWDAATESFEVEPMNRVEGTAKRKPSTRE